MSPWFRLSDPCDALHERFLTALREHVRDWPPSVSPGSSGAFLIDGFLTTYVDVADPDESTVVASLRVDFDGRPVQRHEWFEDGRRVQVGWRFAGESGWLTSPHGSDERRPADRVIDLR